MTVALVSVKSDNIQAIGYDPSTLELFVKFHAGPTYAYDGVSPQTYGEMMKAPSIGNFLSKSVKGRFKHRKLK